MSRLTDLIAKLKAKDPQLAADLEREFQALSSRRSFGLNFERHVPESIELPGRPIRRGDKVRILPPRGSTAKGDTRLWVVKKISADRKHADLQLLDRSDPSATSANPSELTTTTAPLADMVVVAEFRDVIYPGLISTGKVSRGGNRPWHTVINGENYHVLKALTWTHRGKIDAIYIDPPYNSGAHDWKYNNDYVDEEDQYRHSKWLAMMERRLLVAKELLNPTNSVLIVTIDEKEYLRLGLLLEQTFPDAKIEMISTVINPKGTGRSGDFARTNEYIFVVRFGAAKVGGRPDNSAVGEPVQWETMRRRNLASVRGRHGKGACGPNQFYPIFVDKATGAIVGRGDPLPENVSRESVVPPPGTVAVFPVRKDGTEMNWEYTHTAFDKWWAEGYIRAHGERREPQPYVIQHLPNKVRKEIQKGAVIVYGKDTHGAVIARYQTPTSKHVTTQWDILSHSAEHGGTRVLNALIPGRRFPYPKSLYAVEDVLRLFVGDKPNAVVLDFFAGSGTTAHAVMRLNKQDGGNRRCISVTNNEVAADEQKALREKGFRASDPEWEQWGICEYITKPRVQAAITGRTPDGHPINGDYLFGRTVKKEKPRRFKHVSFVNPAELDTVEKKKQFLGLIDDLPQTLVTDESPFVVSEDKKHTASVLFDPDARDDWLEALDGQEHITEFFIIAPDKQTFATIKNQVTEILGPLIVFEEEKTPMADGFEANAEFFTLAYETPLAVSYQTAFSRIAPLLWLRAGSVGRRIDKVPAAGWEVVDTYGLLVDLDKATDFLHAICKTVGLRIAYIVTDDERRFQAITKRLPESVEPIRLYQSYLTNFAFANGD